MLHTIFQRLLLMLTIVACCLTAFAGCRHLPSSSHQFDPVQADLDIDISQATTIDEQWYAMYREGKKTGWRRQRAARVEKSGQSYYLNSQTTYEKYYRYGELVEKKKTVHTLHNMQHRFVASTASMIEGDHMPVHVIARKQNDILQVRLRRGTSEKSKSLRRRFDSMYPLVNQIRRLGLKVGNRKTIQLFDPQDLRVHDYTIRVLSRVDFDAENGTLPAWHVLIERGRSAYQDIFISADKDLTVLKIISSSQPVYFLAIEAHSAESGMEHYDFNETHDLTLETEIASSWSVQTATLDISNEILNRVLIEDPWQVRSETSAVNGTRWIFRARRVDDTKASNLPLTFVDKHKFLNSSFYIQSNHPKIRQTAARIQGDEGNALRLFRKIAMWVFNTLDEKNYKTTLASSVETLERRQGDCTEHSVLTVALARAAGIPARIATGLYYADRRFSYHMWVEALVAEDLWVAVDPSMGQIEPDALHLKIYHGDLDYDTHTNITWELVQSLKPEDLKIVEINKTF